MRKRKLDIEKDFEPEFDHLEIPSEEPVVNEEPEFSDKTDVVGYLCKANVSQETDYVISHGAGDQAVIYIFPHPDFTCVLPKEFAESLNSIPQHPVKIWSE